MEQGSPSRPSSPSSSNKEEAKESPTTPSTTPKNVATKSRTTLTSTSNKKKTKKSRKSGSNPKIEVPCFYPTENLDIAKDIEETMRAVEHAVTGVLDAHHIKNYVQIRNIAAIAQTLENNFATFKVDPASRSSRKIQNIIDEALAEHSKGDDHAVNEMQFDSAMIKYSLFGAAHVNKLSADVCLSIVENMDSNGANVLEYESGFPAKVASSLYKFYDTDEFHFNSLSEQDQAKMKKEYIEEKLRCHNDVKNFLDARYKELKAAGNGDATDPLKDWPEGQLMEEHLAEAFKKNYEMGKAMKKDYDFDLDKDEKERRSYRDSFRTATLGGITGVRNKQEEAEIDQIFASTPLNILKTFITECKNDLYREFDVPDFPSMTTKAFPE